MKRYHDYRIQLRAQLILVENEMEKPDEERGALWWVVTIGETLLEFVDVLEPIFIIRDALRGDWLGAGLGMADLALGPLVDGIKSIRSAARGLGDAPEMVRRVEDAARKIDNLPGVARQTPQSRSLIGDPYWDTTYAQMRANQDPWLIEWENRLRSLFPQVNGKRTIVILAGDPNDFGFMYDLGENIAGRVSPTQEGLLRLLFPENATRFTLKHEGDHVEQYARWRDTGVPFDAFGKNNKLIEDFMEIEARVWESRTLSQLGLSGTDADDQAMFFLSEAANTIYATEPIWENMETFIRFYTNPDSDQFRRVVDTISLTWADDEVLNGVMDIIRSWQ